VLVLLVAWGYLAAMSVEFGCRTWLKRHPLVYIWSHMLIMPLVDFYATACDWVPAAARPPAGLGWFLAASFANGVVIELGRKIRSPADEEEGVETYSALYGAPRATAAWVGMSLVTAIFATFAARNAGAALPVGVVLAVGALACIGVAVWFTARRRPGDGKRIELAAGLWTLLLYGALGLIPPVAEHLHG